MNTYMPPPIMGNNFLGGNVVRSNGIMPSPMSSPSAPQVQPAQVQPPVRNNPTTYYCIMVDTYQDITSAGLPYDGTPVMFMLKTSPHLYIAYMKGEKKYICGYKIVNMDIEKEEESPPTPQETPTQEVAPQASPLEDRIANLEKFMGELKTLLMKGGIANESNPPTPKQSNAGGATAKKK